MIRQFRNHVLMGFLVLLPTIATIYVLRILFDVADRTLGVMFSNFLVQVGLVTRNEVGLHFLGFTFAERIPGIGLLVTVLLLVAVGMATRSIIGRQVIRQTERFFTRIPIARTIYTTVQQITNAFVQDRSMFQRVVLVEYPRTGMYAIGFVTGNAVKALEKTTGKACVPVFLPTTPNPTSGWLLFVPREEVYPLDISVEDGLKLVISGGVVVPKEGPHPAVSPAAHVGENAPNATGQWMGTR